MNRRTFLAAVAVAGSSAGGGCLVGPQRTRRLDLTRVDDPSRAFATRPASFTSDQRALVADAVSDAGHRTYGHRPFADGTYVTDDDSFYRVEVTETGTERLDRPVLVARVVDRDEATDPRVATELPGPEREAVVDAARKAIDRAEDGSGNPAVEGFVLRTDVHRESRLYPEPEYRYVVYARYALELRVETRTVDEPAYTSRLSRVAADADAFRTHVEDVHAVALADGRIDSDQREIVERAIDGEYTERGERSEALTGLLEMLRGGADPGPDLVTYRGDHYRWEYDG